MHIKLIVNSFPSASETFLFNLVTGLQAKGHRVSVCATSASKHLDLYKSRMNEWSGELDVMPLSQVGIQKWMGILNVLINHLNLFIQYSKKKGIKQGILHTLYDVYLSKKQS